MSDAAAPPPGLPGAPQSRTSWCVDQLELLVPRGGSAADELYALYAADGFAGIHPDDVERVKETFRENFEAEHFAVDNYRARGADGSYRWLSEEVELREVRADGRLFYATYRDVSREVRLQEELRRQLEKEKSLRREAMAAMELGGTAHEIAEMCHAHPTLSEAVMEAALAVHKRTINI